MQSQRSRRTISAITLADSDNLERATERFWSKVATCDGCWLWTGGINKGTGYGSLGIKYQGRWRCIDTHRFAYLLTHESIPAGLCICHACDSMYALGDSTYRRCVRPDHLWAGTGGDNARDAARKHRLQSGDRHFWRRHPEVAATFKRNPARGEMTGHAKLTATQVLEICTRYAAGGITQVELSAEYGVNQPHISRILRQTVWGHLEGRPDLPPAYAGNKRLSPQDVRAIRADHLDRGLSLAELARRYAVNPGTIRCIVNRQTWKDI
jgi:hypothetical protein